MDLVARPPNMLPPQVLTGVNVRPLPTRDMNDELTSPRHLAKRFKHVNGLSHKSSTSSGAREHLPDYLWDPTHSQPEPSALDSLDWLLWVLVYYKRSSKSPEAQGDGSGGRGHFYHDTIFITSPSGLPDHIDKDIQAMSDVHDHARARESGGDGDGGKSQSQDCRSRRSRAASRESSTGQRPLLTTMTLFCIDSFNPRPFGHCHLYPTCTRFASVTMM